MKFGVSLWLWTSPITTDVVATFAPKLSKWGFDTIEIPLDEPDLLDASEARKIIEDNGLHVTTCAAMGPGRDLIHPEIKVRDNGMEYMRKCLDKANQLGAPSFAGPIYAEVGRCWRSSDDYAKEMDLYVEQLNKLVDQAESNDVVMCIEPLNRFETSFINLTKQALEVVNRVGSKACKVMIDMFHAGIEEKNLGEAIRLAGKDLYHVQLAENDRGTPGTGQLDWDEVATALKEIDYDRHVIIETFSRDNDTLVAAAAIWRDLEESPDKLAVDGLKFLKKTMK
ncbi:sugar phosphate isomerase/epimerase [Rhodohalobacter sp. SW132]|uniref:sugar phosphate isomerase/epimerase family protein n=1 Tax=Rhodohalobacter sp. SW132 TaxID=2293433 RepID=UPI000E22AE34|nr:sugar phosphate isomerase/epimerase family protein [Rhodohalobacter sp. SW132]REL38077.1 sugar phosphate isomerase/epimerase [Rhodohalobacter sp. SW132]